MAEKIRHFHDSTGSLRSLCWCHMGLVENGVHTKMTIFIILIGTMATTLGFGVTWFSCKPNSFLRDLEIFVVRTRSWVSSPNSAVAGWNTVAPVVHRFVAVAALVPGWENWDQRDDVSMTTTSFLHPFTQIIFPSFHWNWPCCTEAFGGDRLWLDLQ